ncbi:MAG: hypothetical protein ACP6IP_00630 [Candidatus Njordarchaeia archaeon]
MEEKEIEEVSRTSEETEETEEMEEKEIEEEKIEEIIEEKAVEKEKVEVKKKRGIGKVPEYILEKETEKADAERLLTVRFYPKLLSAPKWKRAKKAAKILRELVQKYVKYAPDPDSGEKIRINRSYVWVSPKVNEIIWSRGAKNPPRKLRVRVLVKFLNVDRKGKRTEAELRVLPL